MNVPGVGLVKEFLAPEYHNRLAENSRDKNGLAPASILRPYYSHMFPLVVPDSAISTLNLPNFGDNVEFEKWWICMASSPRGHLSGQEPRRIDLCTCVTPCDKFPIAFATEIGTIQCSLICAWTCGAKLSILCRSLDLTDHRGQGFGCFSYPSALNCLASPKCDWTTFLTVAVKVL